MRRRFPWFWIPALLVAAVGCGGGGGGGGFAPQAPAVNMNPTFNDVEPNNAPGNAQNLGTISPGFNFTGNGSVAFNDAAGDDEFDSFQVVADGAQTITVLLFHDTSTDLDLSFVDPANGNVLSDLGDGVQSPETIVLQLTDGQRVNVEVEAFEGPGDYLLSISSKSN